MNNEEKVLKDKLEQSINSYQIKTTAHQIMETYQQSQEEIKKPTYSYKRTFGILGFAALALAVIIIIPNFIPNESTSNDESHNISVPVTEKFASIISNRSKKGQTAFSLFSAVNVMSEIDLGSQTKAKFMSKMTTHFDKSYDLVEMLFDESNSYEVKIETLDSLYEGQFQYKLTLQFDNNDYLFYSNMSFEEDDDEIETNLMGKLVIGENSYNTSINIEQEDDEQEIEFEVELDDNKILKIEQESEQEEIEYEYKFCELENSIEKTYYEKKLKMNLKSKNAPHCSLKIKSTSPDFEAEFSNIVFNENKVMTVEYSYNNSRGKFIVEQKDEGHRYYDQDNNFEKILKKIQ